MELEKKYSEPELVLLLKQRTESVYNYLYNNYAGALYTTILNIVKEPEQASDVLQEVFIKIWKQIDSYDSSKGRLFTWMVNIARNASIDATRSKGFQNSQQNQSLDETVYSNAGVTEIKTDTIGLRKLVNALKEDQRILVNLAYFEGYTQDEIAKMLNIPLGTVKTRLRTALQQLGKTIKQ